MRCSVIVPTYNRAELLGLTLQSLVRQSIQPHEFEVIVVDDGSSDHTREKVASFTSSLRVRYIFQEDNGYRVAKARNQGILAAQASICVLVDSGILLAPECLESHCVLHEESKHPLAVCGYVYGFNEDNEDAEKIRRMVDVEHPEKTMTQLQQQGTYLDLREEFYAKYGDNFDYLPAPWLVFWTCNVSARRDVLLDVGLFDENFCTWGGEDVELAYRLHRHGCSFVLSRDARSIHHPHEKSYEHNMQAAQTSYLYFARKYKTPITALVPENHFWVINDIIRKDNLPSCEEYMKESGGVER